MSNVSSSPQVIALREPCLVAFETVLGDFHEQGIRYCCWKSSQRVASAMLGDSDLDLLVGENDQYSAERVLLENGFKRFQAVPNRDDPAITCYLGFDEASGRLVHIDLYSRLVTGERLLKNYRIPWERELLAHSMRHPTLPVQILEPAMEALVLVVRVCLELQRTDLVTLRHWNATQQKFATDRDALRQCVDRDQLRQLAGELLGEPLADAVVETFYGGRALGGLESLRSRIKAHFAPHRTYNAFEARLRSTWRTVLWLAGGANKRWGHLPRPWSRRAPGAGKVVALLGVDGSGKSTQLAASRAWLGAEVDVMPIYFGTGDGRPSLILWPLKTLLPLISALLPERPRGSSHGCVTDKAPGRVYSFLLVGWATVVAVEKHFKLLKAHRAASRGLMVLADRYPQDADLAYNDGPLLHRLTGIPDWLRRFEARAYALATRLPPDLILVLDVSPETAARREPSMDPAVILDRIGRVRCLEFPGARVVRINGERPLPDVVTAVKREIWRLM